MITTLVIAACTPSDSTTAQSPPPGRITVAVAGHDLFVPTGFTVNLFAENLGNARHLTRGPDGSVYLSVSQAGRIVRLPDTNGDGVADTVITVASGLNRPFGIAFRGDTMYVGETNAIKRFDPGATTSVTLVSGIPGGGHSTRTLVFGPDGMMYLSVGSSCNICDESDPRRAAVVRYSLDGSGEHLFATGLRNSVGLAFHPTTGELWATNHDRDNLGDDLPPERINILKDGKFYGWPQCYLPGQPNPEYPTADCANVEPPAITFQAHSAPDGLAFYTGTTFPAEYRGDAFVTYHGSWNRSVPTGAKVVRVRVQNGRPVSVEDFVTGWQLPDGSRWGRPVSVVTASDGSLLVSDDMGGRVWRISYGH
ncbi:MAG: sorbosone dehydrogenase family protein [Gemmatimonadetes bacterium]|nr:sorbosone dehydrogenase family protein [Gemmatimonadota bacterium]